MQFTSRPASVTSSPGFPGNTSSKWANRSGPRSTWKSAPVRCRIRKDAAKNQQKAVGVARRAPVHATFLIHIVREDRMATAWPILETRIDVLRDPRKYLRVMRKSTASALSFPIASRNALHLMCTPRRAIAVRPETTLLFSAGIDSLVRDGVPLTTCAVQRNSR
jgi:hypothetical protein